MTITDDFMESRSPSFGGSRFGGSFVRKAGLLLALLALLGGPPMATAALDLKLIMQHPDWIGPSVEAAWWRGDGGQIAYRVKRAESSVRDVYVLEASGQVAGPLSAAELTRGDGEQQRLSRDGKMLASTVGHALFVRRGEQPLSTKSSESLLTRLYTGSSPLSDVQFSADESALQFRSADQWWQVSLEADSVAYPLTDLRFADAPHAVGKSALEQEQLRLFATLERERQHDEERHEEAVKNAMTSPHAGPVPWYLGKGKELVASSLSTDGRYLLAVVRAEAGGAGNGKPDQMPSYVARSGYVDIEDVRTLVGLEAPRPEQLLLLDLQQRERHEIDLTVLKGIGEDPLADLKKAQGLDAHDDDDPRPVTIEQVSWHPAQPLALVQVRSIDNKDRWTLRIDAPRTASEEIHRQSDPAWINPYQFTALGWVPQTDTAWLLSEESGYGHLYTVSAQGRIRQLTKGAFEVVDVHFSRSAETAWLLTNREHPTKYDVDLLDMETGSLEQLTTLNGIESFQVSPDETQLLLQYSGTYTPAQAAVFDLASRKLLRSTDTRTPAYKQISWQEPEFVPVPSSKTELPIWTKFYSARGKSLGPRPIVVFVHGAGYTQNTHHKFPYYFREQMFHNLLTEYGYHVIDMDYRASRGYGRDWRAAIYRQMGTPELEDLIDGVDWVVRERNGDRDRVAIYGGSYGGFMTFMAMFKAPDVFVAGAALRPVTDWRHYNHGYTANILNTPQIDPEAHRISSPIEFVEGLRGDLLISHGMLDDNVFYKDSVRLAQRLLELEKEHWELASYPLEPHGYVHPESWLDQYRRIFKLFERSVGKNGVPLQ
ncbi:MAG: alpha/beta fold hydrolase [Pseudomonadota bacterium]